MKNLPVFFDLWKHYPPYEGPNAIESPKFKRKIGGEAGRQNDPDTCAIRISYTLNKCGHRIPDNYYIKYKKKNAYILSGKNRNDFYFMRIEELIDYLTIEYFKPKSAKSKNGFKRPPEGFRQRGILCFWWGGHGGNKGHMAVWNGSSCAGKKALIYPGEATTTARTIPALGREGIYDSNWFNTRELYLWPAPGIIVKPVKHRSSP